MRISNYLSILTLGALDMQRMAPIESRTNVEPLRPEYVYICPTNHEEYNRKREKRMKARRAQRLRKRRM